MLNRVTAPPGLEKLAKARMVACQRAPYFTAAIYSLVPFGEPGFGTFAVTKGLVLIYDHVLVEKLDIEETAACLIHEINHILRNSPFRLDGDGFDKELANIASDLPINTDLRNAKWKLPNWVVYPEKFQLPTGLTTEEYYGKLLDKKQKGQLPKFERGLGAGKCGGCGHNHADKKREDELDAIYGRSKADKTLVEKQVATDIQQHEKSRGTIGGGWSEWAKGMLKGKSEIPWETVFAHMLRGVIGRIRSGMMDYSMSRPSRRQFVFPQPFLQPGMIAYEPEIAFIYDTSGSMGLNEVKEAIRETANVMQSLGISHVNLIQADVEVKDVRKVTISDLRNLEIKGRGGTSFVYGLEYIQKLRPRPQAVIYVTDGYGDSPPKPPFEVIWCVTSNGTAPPVDWGKKVFIKRPKQEE